MDNSLKSKISINVDAEQALVSILESTIYHSILLLDSTGKILQANEGARRTYGHEISDLVNNNINIFFDRKDINKGLLKKIINTAVRDGRWVGIVNQVRNNGDIFPGHVTITRHSEENAGLKGFVTIIIDMTDRINLENQLRDHAVNLEKTVEQRTRELRSSEAHYRNLVENSPEMIHQLDTGGRFLHVNRTELEKLGFTMDEIKKKRLVDIVPNNCKNEAESFLNILKKTGKCTIETFFMTKSGKEVPVEIDATGFYDHDKEEIKYSIAFTRDISEKQKLMDQIIHQERMASIGLLSAGVAHEIGNPLTSISAITQILQRKLDDEFALQNLSVIRNHIDRINKIVRELVTFSRPIQKKANPTNINHVINSAIQIIKFDRRSKLVDIRTDFSDSIPITMTVEDQLLQVLINIVYNAIDAVECQLNPLIIIGTSYENSKINIGIQDNGIGIPETNLGKLFDPFFTTKEVGKGTGLGLSVSYSIVKNFGGEIRVFSIEKKGSTFTITLPVKKEI